MSALIKGMEMKRVLDPCCGGKMMWFDHGNPNVVFCDVRRVDNELIWTSKDGNDKRYLTVEPDVICDVRHLPFDDNTFYHIVFDPPHIQKIGDNAWLCKKYGKMETDWQSFIHDAFEELMRVLKPSGTLIFKWSEIDIKVNDLLKVIPYKPLYGHRSGKHMTTHWIAFIKDPANWQGDCTFIKAAKAIPIPKHGRLIDADALMELYADTDDMRLRDMKVPIAVIRQNIMDMPTIIPADEPFGKSEQLNV